jgi:hypothetical protein
MKAAATAAAKHGALAMQQQQQQYKQKGDVAATTALRRCRHAVARSKTACKGAAALFSLSLSLSLSMCVCMCVRARMSHVDALFCLGDEQLTQRGAVLHSTAGAVLHSTARGAPSTHQASAVPHAPPRYPDEAANRTGMGGGDGQMGSR